MAFQSRSGPIKKDIGQQGAPRVVHIVRLTERPAAIDRTESRCTQVRGGLGMACTSVRRVFATAFDVSLLFISFHGKQGRHRAIIE